MITNEYINQAIDYILTHINERISVDDIASHCNFSRYYFSRMFKMETGESVYEFIKRTKMEQSAFRLKVEQSRSITDVGLDYGYSASNYSSAFKEHLSLSPIAFRRSILEKSLTNPIFGNVSMGLNSFDTVAQKGSIEHLPDYTVLFERYKGNYSDLSEHWGAFQERYKDYATEDTLLLERTYDDPSITDIDECLYDLCMTIPEGSTPANTYVITGGEFAVSFLFSGINTISSFYFTSIGKAMESAIISCARGLVLLLICIFTLPPLLGMTGVWLVAPITEILTLILSFVFIVKDTEMWLKEKGEC